MVAKPAAFTTLQKFAPGSAWIKRSVSTMTSAAHEPTISQNTGSPKSGSRLQRPFQPAGHNVRTGFPAQAVE